MYIYTPDKMLIDCSSGDYFSSSNDVGEFVVKCGNKFLVVVDSQEIADNIISQIAQALSYGINIVRIGNETGEMRIFYPENVANRLPVDDNLSQAVKDKLISNQEKE